MEYNMYTNTIYRICGATKDVRPVSYILLYDVQTTEKAHKNSRIYHALFDMNSFSEDLSGCIYFIYFYITNSGMINTSLLHDVSIQRRKVV